MTLRRLTQRRLLIPALVLVLGGSGGGAALAVSGSPEGGPAGNAVAAPAARPFTPELRDEIRAELEAALEARRSGRRNEIGAHVHRAQQLAEEAEQEQLASSISTCRSGICLITQVQSRLLRALALLDGLPTTGA